MVSLKYLRVPFTGLNVGTHAYTFDISNEFFEAFEYGLIKKGEVSVNLNLEKTSSFMILHFDFEGEVHGECDRCLEELPVSVEGQERVIVKFGEEDYDNTEDIIVLHPNDYEIDLTQLIYEMISLVLPSKILHEDGECDPDMIAHLSEETEDEEVDPRWEALKALKNKN